MAAVGIEHETIDANGVRLHCAHAGDGPLIVFIHGFPEFWYAWRGMIGVFGRDRLLAVTMAGSLAVTWALARVVKRVVDRPRPSAYLPEIEVRDLVGTDLGYASGHSAIAATWGVMAMAALPPRWRWFGPFCALLVGLARVVHGVHLPADVIGGWCIGTLVALGGLAAVDTFGRVRH